MLEVEVKGINAMVAKLRKHQLIMQGKITETKRKLVRDVFTDLVKGSPQWSGNLASNWYIEFHGNKGSYSPIDNYDPQNWKDVEHYQAGADPAVSRTLQRELSKLNQIRWNSKVQIVNYTPYAQEVEDGQGPGYKGIRPENYKFTGTGSKQYGRIAMKEYVLMKYGQLRTLKRRL